MAVNVAQVALSIKPDAAMRGGVTGREMALVADLIGRLAQESIIVGGVRLVALQTSVTGNGVRLGRLVLVWKGARLGRVAPTADAVQIVIQIGIMTFDKAVATEAV